MAFPNTSHSGNWKMTFSNLPYRPERDLKLLHNFYKSVTIPDYNLEEFPMYGPDGEFERHPSSHKNENLSQLLVEFKISEDFKNYLYLLQWMMSRRYGNIDTSKDDRNWQNVINRITIHALDNQKREISQIYFTDCNLVNLSSFPLDFGTEEEIIFTCSFSYREIGFEIISVT